MSKLELNLIFNVCAKTGLEKAALFNLVILNPASLPLHPPPPLRTSNGKGNGLTEVGLPWTQVLFVIVCYVLKVF